MKKRLQEKTDKLDARSLKRYLNLTKRAWYMEMAKDPGNPIFQVPRRKMISILVQEMRKKQDGDRVMKELLEEFKKR